MDSSAAPSTSTTCTSSEASDTLKIGLHSLAAGKRHLLIKEVQLALPALEEACKLLDQVRGTFSQESGEAHFYYGKALLEQNRIESGLFEGTATAGAVIGPEDYEEDIEEEEEMEDEEENEAPELVAVGQQDGTANEKEPQVENGAAEKKPQSENGGVESELNANGNGNGTEAKEDEPTATDVQNGSENQENIPPKSPTRSTTSSDSEPTNLELAWEVLEVAKLAFSRQLETVNTQEELNNIKKRLADVYLVLGEVANESEHYDQAVQDFDTAIGLIEGMEGGGDKREVAQALFQKGLAYAYAKSFVLAIAAFTRAKELVEFRIAELPADSDEAAELRALLPELEEKIQDTEETQKDEQEDQKKIETEEESSPTLAAAAAAPVPPAAATNGTNEKPANDISHLVKRKPQAPAPTAAAPAPAIVDEQQNQKRMLEEEEELAPAVQEPPEKKQCTE